MEGEYILINGVKISGDFENIEKIRKIGSSIILKLKNGRYFFVNKSKSFDNIEFNTKKDEFYFREYFDGRISKHYSVNKLGIIKGKFLQNIPYLTILGAGLTFTITGAISNSNLLTVLGALSIVTSLGGKAIEIARDKLHEKSNNYYFGEIEDEIDLDGFKVEKENKFEILLTREEKELV